jgi:hypothetical protein
MDKHYLDSLHTQRLQLRQQLEWHEANHAASAEEPDDGTETELRSRIEALSREIAALERLV